MIDGGRRRQKKVDREPTARETAIGEADLLLWTRRKDLHIKVLWFKTKSKKGGIWRFGWRDMAWAQIV